MTSKVTPDESKQNRGDDALRQVTVELRRRLCVMNVHILLKKRLGCSKMSIRLTENSVTLGWDRQQNRIELESVIMMPETVSCLVIKNNWISFRIQIRPDNKLGSFGAQVLGNDTTDDKTWNLSSVALPKKDRRTSICCGRCKSEITQVVEFKRVLPLPSGETFDWFCCSHNVENRIDKLRLVPKPDDYFYTSYYSVLNRTILSSSTIVKDSVRCRRCLSELGVSEQPETVKLWNSSVRIKSDEAFGSVVEPLDDFLMVTKEFSNRFMGETLLIETKDDGLYKYLMLKLMDKKLELLTENSDSKRHVLQNVNDASKVMFLYDESDRSAMKDQPDANYHFVSRAVLAAALDHLVQKSARFPPYYRTIDRWITGYIDYCSFVNHFHGT